MGWNGDSCAILSGIGTASDFATVSEHSAGAAHQTPGSRLCVATGRWGLRLDALNLVLPALAAAKGTARGKPHPHNTHALYTPPRCPLVGTVDPDHGTLAQGGAVHCAAKRRLPVAALWAQALRLGMGPDVRPRC